MLSGHTRSQTKTFLILTSSNSVVKQFKLQVPTSALKMQHFNRLSVSYSGTCMNNVFTWIKENLVGQRRPGTGKKKVIGR